MNRITVHLDPDTDRELGIWLSKTAFALEPHNPKRHLDPEKAIQAMIQATLKHPECSAKVENQLRHRRWI